MLKRNPKVDAYIEKAAEFAKPILRHIRKVVHEACPDAEEEVKWGMPFFMYNGTMCNMAAFREHCAFGFWKGKLIFGDGYGRSAEKAMGSFGRITKISDLPSKTLLAGYIKRAMKLNEEGVKPPTRIARKGELKTPSYFMAALDHNKKALKVFESFTTSQRREYIEWLDEAKAEETRMKRLETAVAWIAGGKVRNWKYIKK